MSCSPKHINSIEFHNVAKRLREFFEGKGFIEVHTQSRLSILAACEDPTTISTYNYGGQVWPLPQTGQMWLEYELLKNPEATGFFCLSTSFRNEPNPVPGRHDKIFPMFEFEMKGSMDDMVQIEKELLTHLGFTDTHHEDDYDTISKKYGIYEGNLTKDFIRLYNLSATVQSIATMLQKNNLSIQASKIMDVAMRDVVTVESLYVL